MAATLCYRLAIRSALQAKPFTAVPLTALKYTIHQFEETCRWQVCTIMFYKQSFVFN